MGKVIMSGIVPQLEAPSISILASKLAVGSSVYLMENGVATEYLVVNQGIPSGSSLYDSSCGGTWLMRKDAYGLVPWNSSAVNDYENSEMHKYLNNTFLGFFDTNTKSAIQQVKIPYRKGSGYNTTVTSGANGLSTKVFLLSGYETGSWGHSWLPEEGACLEYFPKKETSGYAEAHPTRVAYLDGTATTWWLRTPVCFSGNGTKQAQIVEPTGAYGFEDCNKYYGIRPVLILPRTSLFDSKTMLFKEVA